MGKNGRPDFIPSDVFRRWLTAYAVGELFNVENTSAGGSKANNFIAKRHRIGRPIRSIHGKYRPIDVVAAARADGLKIQPPKHEQKRQTIDELSKRINELKDEMSRLGDFASHEAIQLDSSSVAITNKRLLRESEIVEAAGSVNIHCGVYFLISDGHVVYVGQSTNISARISGHLKDKDFDSTCYIPLPQWQLDFVESLYIHLLEPKLNGGRGNSPQRMAPIGFDKLLFNLPSPNSFSNEQEK